MKFSKEEIVAKINQLKEAKNAIILAHYYQENDIQDIADFIGDSLDLSKKSKAAQADIIVFSGVYFMAETAKILSPDVKVLVPDVNAGCSLSDDCPPEEFETFIKQYPDHTVISYINCSADIKALSDIICTSSNAVDVVQSFPKSIPLIFSPDRNLGKYVAKMTQRDMVLWNGSCIVHETFSKEKILDLVEQYPEAKLIAHPECEEHILAVCDFIGSTKAMLDFTQKDDAKSFIVATESGILYQMQLKSPQKKFIPAPPLNTCHCNECPHMKLNTLEKILTVLESEENEILIPETTLTKAQNSLNKMLALS